MRAFGSSGSSASAKTPSLWFEKVWGPFLNFDVDGQWLDVVSLLLFNSHLASVPIFDASGSPFLFAKDDFTDLISLPRYKKYGDRKPADLPRDSIVSVFYTMNTYESTRFPPLPPLGDATASADAQKGGTSTVLSLNMQFVVYHGEIPYDGED